MNRLLSVEVYCSGQDAQEQQESPGAKQVSVVALRKNKELVLVNSIKSRRDYGHPVSTRLPGQLHIIIDLRPPNQARQEENHKDPRSGQHRVDHLDQITQSRL